jgi:hypothetical protein
MNFSNENVLIIAALIGIIIMFLSSSCLCKNNTEQFNNNLKPTNEVFQKISDSKIVYDAILSINRAMDLANYNHSENYIGIINAFIASNAITQSTNNITSPNLVSTIKTLTDPITKAVDASKIPPNIKMTPTAIVSAAKDNLTKIKSAIETAKKTAAEEYNLHFNMCRFFFGEKKCKK